MHTFSIPMRTRFRGITVREGMLWEGAAGWTEFSPFNDYDALQSAAWLDAAHASAERPWPTPLRHSVPVNCTVPAVGAVAAADVVRNSHGCTTAKVKVAEPGQSLTDDLNRVAAVRDELGPTGQIRVDANGGWSIDEAVDSLRALNRAAGGLEYAEQPCRTVEELAAVRLRVDVLIAADESIRHASDPMRVVRLEAADVAVLKVQPLGGVEACLRIAEQIQIPVVVSSALETSIGLAAGVALAAALPQLPYACGLATTSLLSHDVVAEPFVPLDGMMTVRRPTPDARLLNAAAASDETQARWQDRLAAVQSIGQDQGP